ncbi:MAG: O-antigen ligase family protein [Melioribacteraceae bacterium]|nr:O-antigen ligase family protein [Melioribacteraceae bacterium]
MKNLDSTFSQNKLLLAPLILIGIFTLTTVFQSLPPKIHYWVILISLPVIVFTLINYMVAHFVLVFALFINFQYSFYTPATIIAGALLLPFIISYSKIRSEDFKNPLTFYIVLYVLSTFPSYFNSVNLFKTILVNYNLLVFLILFFLGLITYKSEKLIKNTFYIFLVFVIINGFNVVFDAVFLQERAFGFAGIMSTDYTGICIAVLGTALLINYSKRKVVLALLLLFLIGVSIFTQTRSTWLVIILLFGIIGVYLFIKGNEYQIQKKRLVTYAVLILLSTSIIYSLTLVLNPTVATRTEQVNQLDQVIDKEGKVKNSLVSRFFIWHTSFNAIAEHPIIGIGSYSFPFSNHLYYTIPEFLFEDYVKNNSPHVGYLAVLTETGVVGLLFFVLLIFNLIRFGIENVKMASDSEQKKFNLLIFVPLLYLIISLATTDAWLWRQGVVILASVASINMCINRKISVNIS